MISTTAEQVEAELAFARKAAAHFAVHDLHSSYGDLKPGSLLALRWGLGNDCVLVVRLDENFEPCNYQQLIKECGHESS